MDIAILKPVKLGEHWDGTVFGTRGRSIYVAHVKGTTELTGTVKKNMSKAEWENIEPILLARERLNQGNPLSAAKAVGIHVNYPWSEMGKGVKLSSLGDPEQFARSLKLQSDTKTAKWGLDLLMIAEHNDYLKKTRLVMWCLRRPHNRVFETSNGRRRSESTFISLGILCPDDLTSLFVKGAIERLHACPSCKIPFQPDRPNQEFCSTRCGNRFRQSEYRKAKAKTGGK